MRKKSFFGLHHSSVGVFTGAGKKCSSIGFSEVWHDFWALFKASSNFCHVLYHNTGISSLAVQNSNSSCVCLISSNNWTAVIGISIVYKQN